MNVFKKLSSWYFSKNVLPYWVVLLADTVIVFASCCFTFWITNNTDIAFESRAALLYSAFFYSVVSWIGIRIFKTYSGVLRYSSFVDLLKLVYANTVSLAISLGCCWLFSYFHVRALSAFSYLDLVVAFALATFVMWIMRVLVKLVAISGGVAVAKAVRSQTPRRFEVVGFISHEHRIKDMKLLGVKVYSKDADMEAVIKKERIQAMLVSPLRISEFQNNQKIQDNSELKKRLDAIRKMLEAGANLLIRGLWIGGISIVSAVIYGITTSKLRCEEWTLIRQALKKRKFAKEVKPRQKEIVCGRFLSALIAGHWIPFGAIVSACSIWFNTILPQVSG